MTRKGNSGEDGESRGQLNKFKVAASELERTTEKSPMTRS